MTQSLRSERSTSDAVRYFWIALNNDSYASMGMHFTFRCILRQFDNNVGDWGQSLFQLGAYDTQLASLSSDNVISRQLVNVLDTLHLHTSSHITASSRITASSHSSHASHTHRRTHSETYWIPRASFELYRAYFELTTSLLRSELRSLSSLPSSLPNSLGNSECHVDTSNMYIKSM